MKRLLLAMAAMLAAGSLFAATDFSALRADQQALLGSAKTLWPQLDAMTRRELQANAGDWLARSPADRDVLRTRLRAWDNLPVAERVTRRASFAAWQRLQDPERAQLRALAAEFSALAPEQQQLLRTTFAQQSYDQQRGWTLGPTLGTQLAALAPMFAYVPEAERAALFDLLRSLDASARADLSLLVPRLDNAGRERLRRDLQSAPAAERGELIRRRLDRN